MVGPALGSDRDGLTCPWCDRVNALWVSPDAPSPSPGDISICWGCLGVAIFTACDPIGLRQPTDAEQAELDCDHRLRQVRADAARELTPLLALRAIVDREAAS